MEPSVGEMVKLGDRSLCGSGKLQFEGSGLFPNGPEAYAPKRQHISQHDGHKRPLTLQNHRLILTKNPNHVSLPHTHPTLLPRALGGSKKDTHFRAL